MACRALNRGVRSGQGESRSAVIECRTLPGGRVVARLTRGRETCCRVIRIVGVVVVGLMTRHAGSRQIRELPARVACCALNRGVRPGQREAGAAVVKGRILPGGRIVARLARGRESGCLVIRIVGIVVVVLVT